MISGQNHTQLQPSYYGKKQESFKCMLQSLYMEVDRANRNSRIICQKERDDLEEEGRTEEGLEGN